MSLESMLVGKGKRVVKIKGLERLIKRFKTAPRVLHNGMADAAEECAASIHNAMASYPAQRPCDYVRTGNLGRTWQHRVHGGGLLASKHVLAKVQNPTSYAPYVEGPSQAWMHQGHWQTAEDVLEDHKAAIEHAFGEVCTAVVEHLGDKGKIFGK